MSQDVAAQKAIIAIYRKMYRAMLESDSDQLSLLLSDGFYLVHMTGYEQAGEEWLAQIRPGEMRYLHSVEESVAVDVMGQTARLTGRNRVKANIWGARGTWPLQLEIDFVWTEGRWLLAAAYASTY